MISKNSAPEEKPHAFVSRKNGPGPKLNLGCGNDYREGYINVDMSASHKVDLLSDVTWLEPIGDCSCSEVLAQDVLEHIQRSRGGTALREWNRVLEIGGRLVLRVPSLLHLLNLMNSPERQSAQEQKVLIQCLYGTQGYEGDFHFNGFTGITLRHGLDEAGFELVNLRIVDEWMFEAEGRKVRDVVPNPMLRLASDEEFIHAVYIELLGRTPDPDGKEYYTSVLRKGIAREAVIESISASLEHKARN